MEAWHRLIATCICYIHISSLRMHDLSRDLSFVTVFVGAFKIPSVNNPRKLESNAWGILHATEAYHASSDTSLFSSSLPVLPHEKCMCEFFFQCKIFPYL